MGSSQWGKTAIAVNIVAYHIAHDPCPILVVEPTVDPMAKDFAKNRLDPVINASPALAEVVSKKRAKDASNTTLAEDVPRRRARHRRRELRGVAGRALGPPAGRRRDRPLSGGTRRAKATLAIAMKRTTAYRAPARLLLSSPTLKDAPIHVVQARRPAPLLRAVSRSCGHMHPYEWKNVKWTTTTRTARLHCPACDYGITTPSASRSWRRAANGAPRTPPNGSTSRRRSTSGRRTRRCRRSARSSAGSCARASCRRPATTEMHTWQNTTLGEPSSPTPAKASRRRHAAHAPRATAPRRRGRARRRVLPHDGRRRAGRSPRAARARLGRRRGVVARRSAHAPRRHRAEPWEELDESSTSRTRTRAGSGCMIQSTCIDSAGHRTTMVYDYAAKHAARRVYAIIGRDGSGRSSRRRRRNVGQGSSARCRSTPSASTPRRRSGWIGSRSRADGEAGPGLRSRAAGRLGRR
jgi:hypothetical protein